MVDNQSDLSKEQFNRMQSLSSYDRWKSLRILWLDILRGGILLVIIGHTIGTG